ncbi:hypothetical protein PX699_15215 [Sphingobium sp. H39-3-25]|uniref:hypothetical protein n=1 Tax=Sphingobium arseniciresistens TaxID=3030834 RepID=UPI0023B8DE93|nr:hypothetical protein [Sphingobium arseniciresistens]
MSLEPFTYKSDAHLTEVPREPDESLHEYLVRANRTLVGRVRMLSRARDESDYIRAGEQARWRIDRMLLTLAGPLIGAAAYVGLVRAGLAEFARFEVIAGVIAVAGISGGPFVLAFATLGQKLTNWLLSHRSRCAMLPMRRRR